MIAIVFCSVWGGLILYAAWMQFFRHLVFVQRIRLWFTFQTACCYCKGRISGNPFTSNVSHSICGQCKAGAWAEIGKHLNKSRETIL